MVEPTGDPTTLKKEDRAMGPTPEVVRKWSPLVILVDQHLVTPTSDPQLSHIFQGGRFC